MRLFRTGAFVRAARSAKLAPAVQAIPSSPAVRVCPYSTKPFPAQSTSSASETDPRKTQRSTEHQGTGDELGKLRAVQTFQKELESQSVENTIITSASGLKGTKLFNQPIVFDDTTNLSESILKLVGKSLYDKPDHPLGITRRLIESVFSYPTYKNHIATNPVVTIKDNFDNLGFPKNHPGRSRTDTYYADSDRVLRTHTSAHQHAAFEYMSKNPEVGYTICADVYRRDSIDRSHFPVFHQMEGARMWQLPEKYNPVETRYSQQKRRLAQIRADVDALPTTGLIVTDDAGKWHDDTNPVQLNHDRDEVEAVSIHLKRSLEILVMKVFTAAQAAGVGASSRSDEPLKVRWIEAYFPFTSPSYELEVWWQGEWLELLGCGVTQQKILNNAGLSDRIGWAWGIGIERLAMVLFGIPDIRLFWSEDKRFTKQFRAGQLTKFQDFSKYPPCPRDLSFWLPVTSPTASPLAASTSTPINSGTGVAGAAGGNSIKASPTETQPAAFHENDLMEIVRNHANDIVEEVKLIDEFVHPKHGRKSLCYRLMYRSPDKTLTNAETNEVHQRVTDDLVKRFPGLEPR